MRSAAAAFLALALAGSTDVPLPDVTKGSINGRVAVIVMARIPAPALKVYAPEGCEAHLVDGDSELRYPCGKWFQPPAGKYKTWVEKDDLIARTPVVLNYGGGSFHGHGLSILLEVVPGGWVTLPRDRTVDEGQQLRLVHLNSHLQDALIGRAFDRRSSEQTPKLLMPVGPVLAGIFDRSGDALLLARPVTVPAHGTVEVAPEPPRNASDVLVVLDRPRLVGSKTPDPVTMALQTDRGALPPDVFINAGDRVLAVWYGLRGERASVTLTSDTLFLDETPVPLRLNRVTTIRAKMKLRPSVRVSVVLPPGSKAELPSPLRVVAGGRVAEVRESKAVLESLPAEKLEVTLHAGDWTMEKSVDLTSGLDADVVFEPHPIEVSGTLYHGEQRARGELAFRTHGDRFVKTNTDEDGRYTATLWRSGNYVVRLTADDAPPMMQYFVPILESRTLDFQVPDTHYAVRVSDERGQPIRQARVSADNAFEGQTVSQRVVTDDEGIAALPPLRNGTVTLFAQADGFADADPVTVPVSDAIRRVDISMHRIEETARVTILLPDHTPAAGAEACMLNGQQTVWRGTVQPDGTLEVPSLWSMVLVKHPRAGAAAILWQPDGTYTLAPAAPPLVVKAADAGGQAVRFVPVVVWVGDIRLSGTALAFLTDTAPVTRSDGTWTGRNLPAQPVRVLISKRLADPLATVLPFPWAPVNEIRVIE